MKKFTMFSNYLFLFMGITILGLTSCGDDPILDTEIPPTVTLSADSEVNSGGTISMTITGDNGDGAMTLLTLTENGAQIGLDRIDSDDVRANPASLIDNNSLAFAFLADIEAPVAPGTYTYVARVTDENNQSSEATVDVTVVSQPATITYEGNRPFVTGTANNVFNISATAGGSSLITFAVYKDGELVGGDRVDFNGNNIVDNPYTLESDDQDGFDMADVLVRLDAAGTSTYTFEVTDAAGESVSTDVTVTFGTEITSSYSAVLLSNAEGANVLGGLDLESGENVSVNSAEANVIDLGIVSNTDPTWIQKIRGANGTVLRAADSNQPELFNFDNINFREGIVNAYNSGVEANPSEVVQEDDVFIAKEGEKYYLLRCSNVTITDDNNEDFYNFDIKTSIQ